MEKDNKEIEKLKGRIIAECEIVGESTLGHETFLLTIIETESKVVFGEKTEKYFDQYGYILKADDESENDLLEALEADFDLYYERNNSNDMLRAVWLDTPIRHF